MNVLDQEQTSQAVRGLIYFAAHGHEGRIKFKDCSAIIHGKVEQTKDDEDIDDEDPVYEIVEASFSDAEHDQHTLEGVIRVYTRIRWKNKGERKKRMNPNFKIMDQPDVQTEGVTKNCLIAFSRLIGKYWDSADDFNGVKRDPEQQPGAETAA